MANLAGQIADALRRNHVMSTTAVRKTFNTFGMYQCLINHLVQIDYNHTTKSNLYLGKKSFFVCKREQ